MDAPDIDTALAWRGRTVRDQDGTELGTLSELYLDSETSRPAWAGVRRGRLRKTETIVPLAGVSELDDDLVVPFDRDRFDDAPDIDPDVELNGEQERALHEHYGSEWSEPSGDTVTRSEEDDGDGAMIRSEEEVSVGKTVQPSERVRLKKVIVEDEVTETVPVRKEKIQLETDPPPEGEIESVEEVDDDLRR
jgi:sporulation protein YlmC with PRC-barrel domain